MTWAVFRAMYLGLVRDPAALAMSFAMPALFFLVFASIFAGTTTENLTLRVAVVDEVGDERSTRLVAALDAAGGLQRIVEDGMDADRVRELVRRGTADVGLVVRADAERIGDVGGFGPAPLLILADPAREVAVPMLAGQIQQVYFSAMPDVAIGSIVQMLQNQFIDLSDRQRLQLDRGLQEMRSPGGSGGASGIGVGGMVERENVAGQAAGLNQVAYYAGAVALLFLLFAAVNGAVTLLEENESGIMDRVLAGPGSTGVLVNGKFVYLVAQGSIQVTVIFLVAWLVHGVDLPGHLLPWAVTTVLAAACAAALGLVLTGACTSRRQAQALSTVVVLVLSALGGSMVPRFLMPPLLQSVGWLTPNTWALEAYTSIFWRAEAVSAQLVPWGMLAASAAAGLLLARRLARRLDSL